MYYAPYDVICVPKNLSISDDLGQIGYVFLDKTDTSTQNIMEFQNCSINGISSYFPSALSHFTPTPVS